LYLINQCVGECDILFEAIYQDDMDDQYLKNTILSFTVEKFDGKYFIIHIVIEKVIIYMFFH
jgi:hypothetical protein